MPNKPEAESVSPTSDEALRSARIEGALAMREQAVAAVVAFHKTWARSEPPTLEAEVAKKAVVAALDALLSEVERIPASNDLRTRAKWDGFTQNGAGSSEGTLLGCRMDIESKRGDHQWTVYASWGPSFLEGREGTWERAREKAERAALTAALTRGIWR